MTSKASFLEQYKNHPAQRRVMERFFNVVEGSSINKTKKNAITLIELFNDSKLVFEDGLVIGGDQKGDIGLSISELCELVSICFANISTDPVWWRREYWSSSSVSDIETEKKILIAMKEKSGLKEYL